IFFLVALLGVVYSALTGHMRARYPDGYSRISTFARYTSDGKVVRYEAYRTIQCRQPVMSSFRHGYKWTGSGAPRITSDLQTVRANSDGGPSDYDCVELAFQRPLIYGEAAVVHHAMEIDDSDGASEPHVEFRVHEPVQLIVWRVELRHLPRQYRKEARITRRRIDARFNARPEYVARVGFDTLARGYEYHVTRPEPGYFYCLEWDR
ncbi:MAG TPA: hypothetical protein VLK84_15715, partial [Longimicrobium sp.]|nr:hypothetical protein [Longimicrobium sp.]